MTWWLILFAPCGAARAPSSSSSPNLAAPNLTVGPVYVSDSVDVPLRAGASNRYKIIGAVRSGSPVHLLAVDPAKDYAQIRTSTGVKGWIPVAQLTNTPSSQILLVTTRQELETLQVRYADLQRHLNEVVNRPNAESLSYPQLYEEALRLRQQLAQYRKVAADTVAIDERNRILQERVVALERELQIAQQENRALQDENDNLQLSLGAGVVGLMVLAAVLTPKVREQRRAQWNRL